MLKLFWLQVAPVKLDEDEAGILSTYSNSGAFSSTQKPIQVAPPRPPRQLYSESIGLGDVYANQNVYASQPISAIFQTDNPNFVNVGGSQYATNKIGKYLVSYACL